MVAVASFPLSSKEVLDVEIISEVDPSQGTPMFAITAMDDEDPESADYVEGEWKPGSTWIGNRIWARTPSIGFEGTIPIATEGEYKLWFRITTAISRPVRVAAVLKIHAGI